MPLRCRSSVLRLGLAAALSMLALAGEAASPFADSVTLPNGDAVLIGEQGPGLLAAADAGRMEDVLWLLIDEARMDDAIAVLTYVARHRPDTAPDLATLGVRVLADVGDGDRAAAIVSAIARESGADMAAVLKAVRAAGLTVDELAAPDAAADITEDIANLEPGSGPDTPLDAGAEAGPAAPAAPGRPSVEYSGQGGGGGGSGGGLPAGLFIGGGGGGGSNNTSGDDQTIPDPPADAGVS